MNSLIYASLLFFASATAWTDDLFIDVTHANLKSYEVDFENGRCEQNMVFNWEYDLVITLTDGKIFRSMSDSYNAGDTCKLAKKIALENTLSGEMDLWRINTLESILKDEITFVDIGGGKSACAKLAMRIYGPLSVLKEGNHYRAPKYSERYDSDRWRRFKLLYTPVPCP